MFTVESFCESFITLVNQAPASEEEFVNAIDELQRQRNELNDYLGIVNCLRARKEQCSGAREQWNRATGLLLPPAADLRFP